MAKAEKYCSSSIFYLEALKTASENQGSPQNTGGNLGADPAWHLRPVDPRPTSAFLAPARGAGLQLPLSPASHLFYLSPGRFLLLLLLLQSQSGLFKVKDIVFGATTPPILHSQDVPCSTPTHSPSGETFDPKRVHGGREEPFRVRKRRRRRPRPRPLA